MLRYIVKEDGIIIRKFASRDECEVYIQSGCTLTILPRPKKPTYSDKVKKLLEQCGESPF